jgi:hypothetical protein
MRSAIDRATARAAMRTAGWASAPIVNTLPVMP